MGVILATLLVGGLGFGLVSFLLTIGATVIVTAAPFAMAALLGLSYGWAAFFISLVILYSLYSYPEIRMAVVVLAISMASWAIIQIPSMFFLNDAIQNPWLLSFVKLAIGLFCLVKAVGHDFQNIDAFCIPLSSFLKIPPVVQRIIAAILFGFGIMLLITFCFFGILGNDLTSYIIEWVLLIAASIGSYFLLGAIANTMEDIEEF